mmetsp:Transcript_17529/g.31698  ORF Transcript_17529/g.31698 Transcript_17529/m.31698 type:complete len:161 (+) Transcript_17529:340-822(+)
MDKFKDKWFEVVEEEMGEDVHEDQLEYLFDTKKPEELTTTEWIDRMEVICTLTASLKKNTESISERTIINKMVKKNLPIEYVKYFILQQGDKMESLKSVKKTLHTIARAHGIENKLKLKHQQQHRLKQGGKLNGTNDEKEETASKTVSSNLCGLHNRAYE